MDLTYRGSTYKPSAPNLVKVDQQLIGKYRGQDCYKAIYDLSSFSSVLPQLKYRGVEYGGVAKTTVSTEASETAFRIEVPGYQKPIRSSRHDELSALDKVHNDYLLMNLEKRLSAARQKGDQGLVNLLEQEKDQLA